MDKLPKFLLSAIRSACEEFGTITYSVHGDNEKARISIMFAKSDNKQVKRKSGAALRRDNKRLREYNESNSNVEVTRLDTLDDITIENENEITNINNDEPSMECENEPVCASEYTSTQCGDNIERSSVNIDSDLTNRFIDLPTHQLDPIIDVEKTIVPKIKPNRTVKNKNNGTIIDKEKCDLDTVSSPQLLHERFGKIVFKKSRAGRDLLIGKVQNRKLLIVYETDRMQIRTMYEDDYNYEHYEQLVLKEFEDVTETIFWNDTANYGIEKMINYVKNHNL
ncbi:unnamed protein product [Mytilus edulis]|uniref:Uncharacterized protein n=1 Tax=Mytilus edulis TaxID=6550 RepID=A0A8S3RJN7_MYTED|nr:unnamed protein product [Mytilus edulis]